MPSLKKQLGPKRRQKVDWEAVERDYRATSMSLRELGGKHGCNHAAIARKAKKDHWQRDLGGAVRKATNAMLIEQAVSGAVNDKQRKVTSVVLAAAELNKQVVLGQRQRLTKLAAVVDRAEAKLLSIGTKVRTIRDAVVFVQGVANMASAVRQLIELERKVFDLDEAPPAPSPATPNPMPSANLSALFEQRAREYDERFPPKGGEHR